MGCRLVKLENGETVQKVSSEWEASLLYIGMTRAKELLFKSKKYNKLMCKIKKRNGLTPAHW